MNFFICISGNYSCLVAHFYLKRSVSFHLIQSYLPSIMIVAISWVSFWMDIEAVPGRISLGVITLLTVSSQTGNGNACNTSKKIRENISQFFVKLKIHDFSPVVHKNSNQ